ncbi:CBASS cGAMP-activated phospholipase [Dongia sp.]|uniref:CBASS cGAMP-activated phospholipase n=1 Tax=Dongia sp. TaxID=1977262 RepID=UPI0035B31C5E
MAQLGPLKGARIWLSASNPPGLTNERALALQKFVTDLSTGIFRAGGSIIHGSHPFIVPPLLEAAKRHQEALGTRDCLELAASEVFSKDYADSLETWRAHSIVNIVPAVGNDRGPSLTRLRQWMVARCDAIVSIGGKWWEENSAAAGIAEEFELARERGLPGFLLGGLGGAAAGYLDAHPEVLRALTNGLAPEENRQLALEADVTMLAGRVVEQLCRLPLVRGEPPVGATFRILALDGGGIKGTFTAAVLKKWEELLQCKIADHFDLIAGTSTGGILALGLGMGLNAADLVEFYEQRGPTVFPLTSVGRKARYLMRQLIRPKFSQDALRAELERAFKDAPGKQLSDSVCRLVIPSLKARTGAVHAFRTNHHPDLIADRNRSPIDLALATAAAPTYFRAASVDDSAYIDGGVWANNPTLAAVVEAVSFLHVPLNRVDVLSIGTTSQPYAGQALNAGITGWLGGVRIIQLLMHAQAQGTLMLASRLTGIPRMLRVDEMLVPGRVSLDGIHRIGELKGYGYSVAEEPETLAAVKARFLNGIHVGPWPRY